MAKIDYAAALTATGVCFFLASTVAAQLPSQEGVRPGDVSGWGKTRWGMSEIEVKRLVHGRWRPATKDERDEDRHLYVPFVLQDVKLGGRNFIGLFGFDRTDRRLAMVTLHSGIPLVRPEEAISVFERLADELQRELGSPARMVRNNSGHTGFYEDVAVWRFPSSVIDLSVLRPNDAQRAVVLSYAPASEAGR